VRGSFSGGIEGRPISDYIASNRSDNDTHAPFNDVVLLDRKLKPARRALYRDLPDRGTTG
jgi:hypothetical protein